MEEEKIRTTVTISPAYYLSTVDWKAWGINLLKFTAPFLSVFFAQLALGVNWKVAGMVAMVALYAALSDLFGKYKKETLTR